MNRSKSAGGIVVNEEGKVLVVNQDAMSWSLPKGHVEDEESPLEAAKREIYEESGIDNLKLIKEFEPYKRYKISDNGKSEDTSEEKEIHLFMFKTTQSKLSPEGEDISEAKWMDKDDVAAQLTHPTDRQNYLKFIQHLL